MASGIRLDIDGADLAPLPRAKLGAFSGIGEVPNEPGLLNHEAADVGPQDGPAPMGLGVMANDLIARRTRCTWASASRRL